LPDAEARAREYARFVDDLKIAAVLVISPRVRREFIQSSRALPQLHLPHFMLLSHGPS
jgi:hypothetical protein